MTSFCLIFLPFLKIISEELYSVQKVRLGSCGQSVFIETPVHMSYGNHVHLGEHFYVNFNLVLVDDGEITEHDKEYYFRDMKVDYPYTLRKE